MAGNFHSHALKVVERYAMTDVDTTQYSATIGTMKALSRGYPLTESALSASRTDVRAQPQPIYPRASIFRSLFMTAQKLRTPCQ